MGLNITYNKNGQAIVYDSSVPDIGTTRHQKDGGHFRFRENRPLPHDHDAGLTCKATTKNIKQAQAFLLSLCADPVRSAQLSLAIRRPAGVSKERFGAAATASAREPMLTANPGSVLVQEEHSTRQAKGKLVKRIVVKPLSRSNAKMGRSSSFWGERTWAIYQLKYSRGYTITTDYGADSGIFRTVGELVSAVTKSGWEVIR